LQGSVDTSRITCSATGSSETTIAGDVALSARAATRLLRIAARLAYPIAIEPIGRADPATTRLAGVSTAHARHTIADALIACATGTTRLAKRTTIHTRAAAANAVHAAITGQHASPTAPQPTHVAPLQTSPGSQLPPAQHSVPSLPQGGGPPSSGGTLAAKPMTFLVTSAFGIQPYRPRTLTYMNVTLHSGLPHPVHSTDVSDSLSFAV
jgi:hypothetical protein